MFAIPGGPVSVHVVAAAHCEGLDHHPDGAECPQPSHAVHHLGQLYCGQYGIVYLEPGKDRGGGYEDNLFLPSVIIPPATKLGGVYWIQPVCLSVCLSVHLSVR